MSVRHFSVFARTLCCTPPNPAVTMSRMLSSLAFHVSRSQGEAAASDGAMAAQVASVQAIAAASGAMLPHPVAISATPITAITSYSTAVRSSTISRQLANLSLGTNLQGQPPAVSSKPSTIAAAATTASIPSHGIGQKRRARESQQDGNSRH